MKLPPNILLLDHTIHWPEVPPRTSVLGRRNDFWRRVTWVLWLVASGYSLVTEIRELVAARESANPQGGAIRRLIPRIAEAGFLETRNIRLPLLYHRFSLGLVKFSLAGLEFVNQLGWQPVETEWERMMRLHEKGKQDEASHTLAVIAFAYHARLRGYQAEVVPDMQNSGRFAPDALIAQGDEHTYAEVELGKQKFSKWEQMADYQGYVAVCASTPYWREKLIAESECVLDIPGRATDLQTLFAESWNSEIGPLWAECW